MIELKFRIRSGIFDHISGRRNTIRPVTLYFQSVEEAALVSGTNEAGQIVPLGDVFLLSFPPAGPVIEGFQDCALGEFVKAQIQTLLQEDESLPYCEINGLEAFLNDEDPERAARIRDLISVCEFRQNELSPESALRFLKENRFFDDYIIVGVKYGAGWRRSRCITTFEDRAHDAATILGHLAEYFQKNGGNGKIHGAD